MHRNWWWSLGGAQASPLVFSYVPGLSIAAMGGSFARAFAGTYNDQNSALQTAAAGVIRDGHYINGVRTLLLEGQRTNSFLNSGTPASHTSPSLSTGTYTLWLVGTGSIAVAAGTATITGAGTATAASPVTFTVTGAGTVVFTVTGSPTRAQCENGAFASSYIATAGSAVTRSVDVDSFPFLVSPQSLTAFTKFVEMGTVKTTSARVLVIGSGNPRFIVLTTGTFYQVFFNNGTSTVTATLAAAPNIGDTVELRAVLNPDGSVFIGQSINGAAETVTATSATSSLPAAWSAQTLAINCENGATQGFNAFQSVKIALGVRTLDQMRAAF